MMRIISRTRGPPAPGPDEASKANFCSFISPIIISMGESNIYFILYASTEPGGRAGEEPL